MRWIKPGDIVRVNFNGAQITLSHRAEVLRLPQDVGDSWKIRDTKTGEIHYVSEGCTITLLEQETPE